VSSCLFFDCAGQYRSLHHHTLHHF
jgi:hypothetical protein